MEKFEKIRYEYILDLVNKESERDAKIEEKGRLLFRACWEFIFRAKNAFFRPDFFKFISRRIS